MSSRKFHYTEKCIKYKLSSNTVDDSAKVVHLFTLKTLDWKNLSFQWRSLYFSLAQKWVRNMYQKQDNFSFSSSFFFFSFFFSAELSLKKNILNWKINAKFKTWLRFSLHDVGYFKFNYGFSIYFLLQQQNTDIISFSRFHNNFAGKLDLRLQFHQIIYGEGFFAQRFFFLTR